MKDSSVIQSVDRALSLLDYLAKQGPSQVIDMAEHLDVHKSTAFRLLATLEYRGYVVQDSHRGKYRLGLGVLPLAHAVSRELELIKIAKPYCEALSYETQETVNLAVLDRDEVINVDQTIGSAAVISVNWMGQRHPLSCTSTGKVMLAFMADAHDIFTKPLERCTPNSVQKFEWLEKELKDIRAHGYGFSFEELEIGLNAVAAPIWSFDGMVQASICISGPSYRLTKERMSELGPSVKQAGLEISGALGFRALQV